MKIISVEMINYGRGYCKDSKKYPGNYPGKIGKDGCLKLCKQDQMCTYISFGGRDTSGPKCWQYSHENCNLGYSEANGQSFITFKKVMTGIALRIKTI